MCAAVRELIFIFCLHISDSADELIKLLATAASRRLVKPTKKAGAKKVIIAFSCTLAHVNFILFSFSA